MADTTRAHLFRWNGREVTGHEGETIAEALYRTGHLSLAATRKRHRPLGLSGSFIQGVLANVNGVPNMRLDQVPVTAGLDVQRQNCWPNADFDLLKIFRIVPQKWLRGGFEHTMLLPSGTQRFVLWERLLAFLAGEGTLAPSARPAQVTGRRLTCDVLVIGAGPAGIAAASEAARAGRRVILVTRGQQPARFAAAMQTALPSREPAIEIFTGHEACAVYRSGRLVLAAPLDGGPALAIENSELILATGKRSMPPLVCGNTLPGVMDAQTGLSLAASSAKAMGRVVVVGTGQRDLVTERLQALGVEIAASVAVADLRMIKGRTRVDGVDIGRNVACDTVVHAGPWRSDPNLVFQSMSEGTLRLTAQALGEHVRITGSASEPDENIIWSGDAHADVCPCMDVTAGEISDLVHAGVHHVEEIKRQTSAGMGPCQGFPCWELMNAVVAASGGTASDRPSHRPPRRAITVAQAAGLADLVEPLR